MARGRLWPRAQKKGKKKKGQVMLWAIQTPLACLLFMHADRRGDDLCASSWPLPVLDPASPFQETNQEDPLAFKIIIKIIDNPS